MSMAQILAVLIFVVMFVMIVLDKIEKQYVTLSCGALTLILVFGVAMHSMSAITETLNFGCFVTRSFWYTAGEGEAASQGINWATIVFLFGMMVMVEGMAKAGFFRWLCLKLAKKVNYRPMPLFITFMIMAAVLAMFIDSITVILFLAAISVEIGKLLAIDPVPMILTEVFCANLGGSATMCGDPPNIIIGTALGYSFGEFVYNTGLIALAGLVIVVVYFSLIYRKTFQKVTVGEETVANMPAPESAISSRKEFTEACVIFGCAVVLLVTHSTTGLTVALIGVFIAALTLCLYHDSLKELLMGVDYKTLLFFTGLFVVVGGLEQTGILEIIAGFIGKIAGGNVKLMVAIILWISACASAFVDNIPFAATMIPIIRSLAETQGVDLSVLAWTLSIGTDIGGSATPIGASANVVGISVAGKNGYRIGWKQYCTICAPAMIIVVTVSMLIIFARYC